MIRMRRDWDLVIFRVGSLASAAEAVRDDRKRRINRDQVIAFVSQTWIYFCYVHACQSTCSGEFLADVISLPDRETSRDRCSGTRGQGGVQSVNVKTQMNRLHSLWVKVVHGLLHHILDPMSVHLGHRERLDAKLLDDISLSRVHVPETNVRDVFRRQAWFDEFKSRKLADVWLKFLHQE